MDKKMYTLSYPQKTIWYMEKLYKGSGMTNICGTVRFKIGVDFELLRKAINIFVSANDAMRVKVLEDNGVPYQYIKDYKEFDVKFVDFSNKTKEDFYRWEESESKKPIDTSNNELFEFIMIKFSDSEGGYLIKVNHIISDAWSIMLLVSDIKDIYSSLVYGKFEKYEKPSYLDYIDAEEEYFTSKRYVSDKEYWEDKLKDFEEVTTLKDNVGDKSFTNATRKTFLIPDKLNKKMKSFCEENKVSEYALFIGALAMYINRVKNKENILFGTSLLNRTGIKEKETIGMFASTAVPLKVDIKDDTNFSTFIKEISKEIMSVLRHQKYPYEEILKIAQSANRATDKVFDIVLNYQNAKGTKGVLEQEVPYSTRWNFNGEQIESLIVNVNDRDNEGKLIIDYDFLNHMFCVKEIEFLHQHIVNILWHALDNPEKLISKLEMLSEAEKNQILFEFNNTACEYPKEKTLDTIFEEQVRKTPDNVALICEDEKLTYSELNDRAEKVAYKLRGSGVKPDDIVGVIMYRSLEMIIGIIGIHKAGAAYMPIDPDYPEDRIQYMIENSGSKIVITHDKVVGRPKNVEVLEISNNELKNEKPVKVNKLHNSRNLAYIIYTSGSTGKPKGAMIEHWSAINRINWMQKFYPLDTTDVILQKTPYTFDVSVWELVWWYFVGAKVCMLEPGAQKYPDKIINYIEKYKVTTMHFVPSMLNAFLEYVDVSGETDRLSSLRRVFASGEALLIDQVKKYNRLIFDKNNAPLINLYGPTEATVDVSYFNCSPTPENGIIPIGKPIDNIQLYVLDKNKNLMPIGVVGELYIAGDGLARGYVNNKELTDEKFVDNPFTPGKKMYKTGDLCKFMAKGDIEYIGRIDFQIKIRGFRIEIGEIEARIKDFEGVKESVVVVNTDEKTGIKNLCAYFTAKAQVDIKQLKKFLGQKMPSYMVPSYYMQLDKMPLSANGKLDRKQLPKIEQTEEVTIVPPQTEEQKILAETFKSILQLKEIGINQDIFELGADSLKIIGALTNLLKYDWKIGVQDFYKYPTIQLLSEKITNNKNGADNVDLSNIQKVPEIKNKYKGKMHLRNILLTGATGFLGVHILREILKNTDANVYCLVRNGEKQSAVQKLESTLDFYFDGKYKEFIDNRIKVVVGDVSFEKLGLGDKEYDELGQKIDSIIHTAAIVKYYGIYNEVKKVNVDGTNRIIDFAKKFKIRLNHISTLTITGEYLVDNDFGTKTFSEKDFYIGQKYLDNIYVRSKFEGENSVLKAMNEGLDATILRVGNLTGRYEDGKFQRNISENAFYDAIKSIFERGSISKSIENKLIEFTAVDKASEAILAISCALGAEGRVFHICNNKLITVKKFVEYSKMFNEAHTNGKESQSIGMIYLDEKGDLIFESDIDVKSEITDEFLKDAGFKWPEIDEKYVDKLINYMKSQGYIEK